MNYNISVLAIIMLYSLSGEGIKGGKGCSVLEQLHRGGHQQEQACPPWQRQEPGLFTFQLLSFCLFLWYNVYKICLFSIVCFSWMKHLRNIFISQEKPKKITSAGVGPRGLSALKSTFENKVSIQLEVVFFILNEKFRGGTCRHSSILEAEEWIWLFWGNVVNFLTFF